MCHGCGDMLSQACSAWVVLLQALAEQVTSKHTQDAHMLAEERKRKNYADFWNPIPVTEPFRVVLSDIRDRLYHTRELLHHCLVHSR